MAALSDGHEDAARKGMQPSERAFQRLGRHLAFVPAEHLIYEYRNF